LTLQERRPTLWCTCLNESYCTSSRATFTESYCHQFNGSSNLPAQAQLDWSWEVGREEMSTSILSEDMETWALWITVFGHVQRTTQFYQDNNWVPGLKSSWQLHLCLTEAPFYCINSYIFIKWPLCHANAKQASPSLPALATKSHAAPDWLMCLTSATWATRVLHHVPYEGCQEELVPPQLSNGPIWDLLPASLAHLLTHLSAIIQWASLSAPPITQIAQFLPSYTLMSPSVLHPHALLALACFTALVTIHLYFAFWWSLQVYS
jgi:hypothetical protein